MVRLRALAPVFDGRTGRTYTPGTTFELDDAQAEAAKRLVASGAAKEVDEGAVDPEPEPEPEGGSGSLAALHEGMTRAQLVEVAAIRGIDVPARATKAEIIEMLG